MMTTHDLTPREQQLIQPLRRRWLQGLEAQRQMQEILGVIAEARGIEPATASLSDDGTHLYTREEASDGHEAE